MTYRLARTAVIGASALALCATGAGVALASTPADVPAAVATAAGAKAHEHRHPGEHGEFTGAGKQHRTIDFQRGTVTAVAGNTITVRSKDGFTQTYTFGPHAKVRKDRQQSTPSGVQTGNHVFVRAVKEADGLQAARVRDHGAGRAHVPGAPGTTG